jgi:hypothetical protein
VLVDTQAWRYRDAATFTVPKLMDVAHAPPAPLDELTAQQFSAFVMCNLETQASMAADA